MDWHVGVLVLVVFLAVVVLGLVPFLLIWSFNTLFGLSIAYNITNWVAALVLFVIFGGTGVSRR